MDEYILTEEDWEMIEELTCNMDEDERNEFLMDIDWLRYSLDDYHYFGNFCTMVGEMLPNTVSTK